MCCCDKSTTCHYDFSLYRKCNKLIGCYCRWHINLYIGMTNEAILCYVSAYCNYSFVVCICRHGGTIANTTSLTTYIPKQCNRRAATWIKMRLLFYSNNPPHIVIVPLFCLFSDMLWVTLVHIKSITSHIPTPKQCKRISSITGQD